VKTRHLLTAALAAAVVTVVGCGDDGNDGSSNEAEIEAVVSDYGVAIADGDATEACALLAPAGQRQIEQQQATLTKQPIDSCPAAVSSLTRSLSPEDAQASREIELKQIEVDGDSATARVVDGNGVRLVRSGEEWLIAGFTP